MTTFIFISRVQTRKMKGLKEARKAKSAKKKETTEGEKTSDAE